LSSADSELRDLCDSLRFLEVSFLLEALETFFAARDHPEDVQLTADSEAAFERARYVIELKLLVLQELRLEAEYASMEQPSADPVRA